MTKRKVAIITGSGTGVGAATALLLSKQGSVVNVSSIAGSLGQRQGSSTR